MLVTYRFIRWEVSAFCAWEIARSWQLLGFFFSSSTLPRRLKIFTAKENNAKESQDFRRAGTSSQWLHSYSFKRHHFWKMLKIYLFKNSLLSSFWNDKLNTEMRGARAHFLNCCSDSSGFILITTSKKSLKWWGKKKSWEKTRKYYI